MCSWQSLRGPALPVGRKGLNRRLEAEKAPPEQTKHLRHLSPVSVHSFGALFKVACHESDESDPNLK